MQPKEVLEFAKEKRVQMVDVKFVDLFGIWQHFSIPIHELEEGLFEDGLGFDGSSIRGWQAITASDMLVIPEAGTAVIDPFVTYVPTLSLIANIVDPITREPYSRDPRYVARKAINHLKATGLADPCFIGPEPEFFIFDQLKFSVTPNHSFYEVDSEEGIWNSGRGGCRGRPRRPRGARPRGPPPPPRRQRPPARPSTCRPGPRWRRRGAAGLWRCSRSPRGRALERRRPLA